MSLVQRYALRVNNTTGFSGVSYSPRTKKYRAYARHNGKQIGLGTFDNVLDAGNAAIAFRLKHYPLPPERLCIECGNPASYGHQEHCNACLCRSYRARRAKREGRAFTPRSSLAKIGQC